MMHLACWYRLVRRVEKSIILIDNYVDVAILNILTKKKASVCCQ